MQVTATVRLARKHQAWDDNVLLVFEPDYLDGRNGHWATNAPHLVLNMTVNGSVGAQFHDHQPYLLTFTEVEA